MKFRTEIVSVVAEEARSQLFYVEDPTLLPLSNPKEAIWATRPET